MRNDLIEKPARLLNAGDVIFEGASSSSQVRKVMEVKTVEHLKCGTHASDSQRTWCYNTPGNLVLVGN